jgi:gluconate 5-dehydrogenase
LEFIDLLIDQTPTASVYALLTCRPEFQPDWSHRSYLSELSLNGRRDRRGLFEFDLEDMRRLLEIDLVAPFNLSRQAAQLMMPQGEGRIINITSIAGPLANEGDAVYTAAKGGLAALTRALAAELGKFNITVNGIAPGFFATETNEAMVANPDIADWLNKRTSLGRWGQPEEIAGAAVFFASPAAAYITGQILAVDGGYVAHF